MDWVNPCLVVYCLIIVTCCSSSRPSAWSRFCANSRNRARSGRIGTAQTQTFIAGIAATGVIGTTVMVDANGQLGIGPPSSARYKQDITAIGARSTGVFQLRPVTFAYRTDASGTAHYGLIAEEVAAVYPELVVRAATGEVRTVKYLELIPMLLNELQREHQEVAGLRKELEEVAVLRKELAELRALMGSRLGQPAVSHAEAR